MTSRNDDRLARLSAAVDRVWGEDILILRRTGAGMQAKAARPDPDRAPLAVRAKFFTGSAVEKPDQTVSGRKHFIMEVAGVADRATVDLSVFASPADWPQRGDRLQRLELAGEPTLEVLEAAPDQTGRLTITLGRVTA